MLLLDGPADKEIVRASQYWLPLWDRAKVPTVGNAVVVCGADEVINWTNRGLLGLVFFFRVMGRDIY